MDKHAKIFILIPLISALIAGIYFGFQQYRMELAVGNYDAIRWAVAKSVLFAPIGLAAGLILNLFVWLIISLRKAKLK